MIRRVAIAIRVGGELHSLDQGDAAARAGNGTADLDPVEIYPGGDTLAAADNVGNMRAVTATGALVERVGIRRKVGIWPVAADEVVAADDPGRRETAWLDDIGIIRRKIGRIATAAEGFVQVVDARVEHRDLHAATVKADVLHHRGGDVRHGFEQVELVVDDTRDTGDVGVVCQRADLVRVDFHEHAVQDGLDAGQHRRARRHLGGAPHEGGLLVLELLLLAHAVRRPVGRDLGSRR